MSDAASEKVSVLFVCLGNICRSPLAEAAMRRAAAAAELEVVIDSAGIGGWHAGEMPDGRARAVAARHGIDISGYRARQVKGSDFTRFTHLVAMDHENLEALRRLAPAGATAELSLMLDHVPGRVGQAVADPYYGADAGFDLTWAQVTAGAEGLVARLRQG